MSTRSCACSGRLPATLTRRSLLQTSANGFGMLALSALMADGARAATTSDSGSRRTPHFKPRAKNVIFCFMDGGGTPGFSSGAPVFVQAGLRFVLWGILESTNSASTSTTFQGLAGLVPANSVAETVQAMAAAQERNLHKPR